MSTAPLPLPAATAPSNNVPNRLTDLVMLMADLYAGQEVHSHCIKRLLTAGEWHRFRFLMHGPALPTIPSAETLDHLREYRQRLKRADYLYRSANARKRNRTWIGPDLFCEAETAYGRALEALEEALGDHPYTAHYLSPFPDFNNPSWLVSASKGGMPRLKNAEPETLARVYSREGGEEYALTAIEILRGIARRELGRAKPRVVAPRSHSRTREPRNSGIADF